MSLFNYATGYWMNLSQIERVLIVREGAILVWLASGEEVKIAEDRCAAFMAAIKPHFLPREEV